MAWPFLGSQRVGKSVIDDVDDAVFLIRRLGIGAEGELLDLLERNIPKARLTPMAGFFAKEMLRRARE